MLLGKLSNVKAVEPFFFEKAQAVDYAVAPRTAR
jgi:hypothetical protein